MENKLNILTTEDVLEALRLWHGGDTNRWPLAHLRLNRLAAAEQAAHGSLAETGPAAANRAILTRGLDHLKGSFPEGANLLRNRFENKRDVMEMANQLNIAETTVNYRQRQAVQQLTTILCQIEESAGSQWQTNMLDRLDLPSYEVLVGIEEPFTQLSAALLREDAHFISVVDGIGGIGKTALAHWTTRQIIQTTRFDDIAWVTAKQTHLSAMGRLQVESGRPALTFPILLERLAEQFALVEDSKSHLHRQRQVKAYLQEQACLVVIDNLETMTDFHTLLPALREWQSPSKFLLTSRRRLLDQPEIFSVSLDELSRKAAFDLLRLAADRSGFSELATADEKILEQIYTTVGGNPLALKLLVGQLRFYPLSQVLARFSRGTTVDDASLFNYIYREIWESLNDENKEILLALTQASGSGFTFERLLERVTFPQEILVQYLEELILLSLVDQAGTLAERQYRLHRLTEQFLTNMFE
jgi:hypothetical protein